MTGMTPKINRPSRWLAAASVLILLLIVTAALIYLTPSLKERFDRKWDFTLIYLSSVLQPVGAMPTVETTEMATTSIAVTTPSAITPTTSSSATLLSPTPTPLPSRVVLTPPDYVPSRDQQTWNNCGPATLALYLRYYRWKGDQATIAKVVKPFDTDRNVNVDELREYVRTHVGWLDAEFRVGGTADLLRQLIAAGYPVMIEEAFIVGEDYWINDDHWTGHYLLLTGYDDSQNAFITQDVYKGPDQLVSYSDLDKDWQAFNRVYLLVFTPDNTSDLQALLGNNWDEATNRQNALKTAQAETQANPLNAFAWFNVGSNLTYLERYSEAAAAYDRARQIGLPQRMLRYQFGPFDAYFQTGRIDDLMALTQYALERTPNSEEALLWRGWALYHKGDRASAEDTFQQALLYHPGYADAIYAINYLNGK
jgi:hypothetical protein